MRWLNAASSPWAWWPSIRSRGSKESARTQHSGNSSLRSRSVTNVEDDTGDPSISGKSQSCINVSHSSRMLTRSSRSLWTTAGYNSCSCSLQGHFFLRSHEGRAQTTLPHEMQNWCPLKMDSGQTSHTRADSEKN